MQIEHLQHKNVQIESIQSTFFVLKNGHDLLRFDFLHKKEFDLRKGVVGNLEYFESHPLLLDYSENLIDTFISSKPQNSDKFITELQNAINEVTLGWRNWKDYVTERGFFSFDTFVKNIIDGNGRLSKAPYSITQSVLKVCEQHNVIAKAFENNLKTEDFKLIMINGNFVIAKDFIFRRT